MIKIKSRRTQSRRRTAPASLGRFAAMVTMPVSRMRFAATVTVPASRRPSVVMTPPAAKPRRLVPPPPHRDPKVVKQAEKIFAAMGMTPAEAVALFYKQTALHGQFPITELIPNEETQAAIRDARAGIGIKKYASVAEMRADLNNDA